MSITANNILTRVEAITKRAFTSNSDIENELKDILLDLSLQGPFIPVSTSGTIAASAQIIEMPTNCGCMDCIKMSSDLILYEIPLADVIQRQQDGFAVKNRQLFIYPVSVQSRDYVLYYGKRHANTIVTIEFDDEYLSAIIHGVAWKIYARFSIYDKSKAQYELYMAEIERHKKRLRKGD